jgi:hypothetical protein
LWPSDVSSNMAEKSTLSSLIFTALSSIVGGFPQPCLMTRDAQLPARNIALARSWSHWAMGSRLPFTKISWMFGWDNLIIWIHMDLYGSMMIYVYGFVCIYMGMGQNPIPLVNPK